MKILFQSNLQVSEADILIAKKYTTSYLTLRFLLLREIQFAKDNRYDIIRHKSFINPMA